MPVVGNTLGLSSHLPNRDDPKKHKSRGCNHKGQTSAGGWLRSQKWLQGGQGVLKNKIKKGVCLEKGEQEEKAHLRGPLSLLIETPAGAVVFLLPTCQEVQGGFQDQELK